MNTHNRNINDPVYGFIRIDGPLINDIISHPYMQRLRHISQIGLSSLVYPGAVHNRFTHSIGAMHLMGRALTTLREKGFEVTMDEYTAAQIAILLHDVGHAPFSHTLEGEFLEGVCHEDISLAVMNMLRSEMKNKVLDMAVDIFENKYPKRFLHSLISSQLDMDRLDYLNRDSFYTGASEGIVSHERIIAMMTIADGDIVFDEKGLYSVEKFVIARRMMYWQVYLHKTVLAADTLANGIVRRAIELTREGVDLPAPKALKMMLRQKAKKEDINKAYLQCYMSVDETDMWSVFKQWINEDDFILSHLCKALCYRRLFFAKLISSPLEQSDIQKVKDAIKNEYGVDDSLMKYLFTYREIKNHVYRPREDNIKIISKNGDVKNITEVSEQINFTSDKTEMKYFVSFPKKFKGLLSL
ncbi:MAG: HD domain-containing protein [Flavobacteriales bacterium]|nr:HD domain-containing protein [Flavobacteriales bacterium]